MLPLPPTKAAALGLPSKLVPKGLVSTRTSLPTSGRNAENTISDNDDHSSNGTHSNSGADAVHHGDDHSSADTEQCDFGGDWSDNDTTQYADWD